MSIDNSYLTTTLKNKSKRKYYWQNIVGKNSLYFKIPGEELLNDTQIHQEYLIVLTNYRIFSYKEHRIISIPLKMIDGIKIDSLNVQILCKDLSFYEFDFNNIEALMNFNGKLNDAIIVNSTISFSELFTSTIISHSKEMVNLSNISKSIKHNDFLNEYHRLGFNELAKWRITEVNVNYNICKTYPQWHIIPKKIDDNKIENCSKFRSHGRFPSVTWRCKATGAVLVRSSQPQIGFLHWRCEEDEQLIQEIVSSACKTLNKESNKKSMCILDARSYTAAMGNRTKGGGFEWDGYYIDCEVYYMDLENIHSLRKSFERLRNLLCKQNRQGFGDFESTGWPSMISSIFRAANHAVLELQSGRSVLVHCSDGWDRTPQIVSLVKIILDPFYRTFEGFRILIEREWIEFGHKFEQRCGHSNNNLPNEKSPVFLIWLDCVHQLLLQFPTSFQFNINYLVKLAKHTYSCLFGSFRGNDSLEKEMYNNNSFPVWTVLNVHNSHLRNSLYQCEHNIIKPSFDIKHIIMWNALFFPRCKKIESTLEVNNHIDHLTFVPLWCKFGITQCLNSYNNESFKDYLTIEECEMGFESISIIKYDLNHGQSLQANSNNSSPSSDKIGGDHKQTDNFVELSTTIQLMNDQLYDSITSHLDIDGLVLSNEDYFKQIYELNDISPTDSTTNDFITVNLTAILKKTIGTKNIANNNNRESIMKLYLSCDQKERCYSCRSMFSSIVVQISCSCCNLVFCQGCTISININHMRICYCLICIIQEIGQLKLNHNLTNSFGGTLSCICCI